MKKKLLIGFNCMFLFWLVSSQQKPATTKKVNVCITPKILWSGDTDLHINNGRYYHKDSLFAGTVLTKDTSGKLASRRNYRDGVEEGWSEWYFPNGQLLARRYFFQGEKDSVHRGWWPNGKMQFEYHFNKGNYNGWFREWYVSRKPLKAIWYSEGEEQYGTGWRENGKVYMSFEFRNGRLYGLVNPNLCYSLKNELGEYMRSLK